MYGTKVPRYKIGLRKRQLKLTVIEVVYQEVQQISCRML